MLAQVVQRVGLMSEFATVLGAAELTMSVANGAFADAAYCYLKSRRAEPNTLVNAVSQRIEQSVVIAFWVRDVSDAAMAGAHDTATRISDAVIAHLLGWVPAERCSPLHYVNGRVVLAPPTVGLLWADEFKTTYTIRKT